MCRLRGENMLTRLGDKFSAAEVRIADAAFPSPFKTGLEYSSPARGTWNIVHTGMLVPQAHEIFVCAQSCLRGVVLTAAEMNACDRFSTVTVKENNLLDGDMEELIIEGVTDILNRLSYRPRAVLVYSSCIHHFVGCDLALCYNELRRRFPDILFTDCYMNPIMRKSGLTPDQLMRRQLYSLLEKRECDGGVNVIGNDFSTYDTSELAEIIEKSGRKFREITRTESFDEYLEMACSEINISYIPPARAAGDYLLRKLGTEHIYLPASFNFDKIKTSLKTLSERLCVDYDVSKKEKSASEAIVRAKKLIGNTPIAIDYTAVSAPLSLARLLSENGFNVVSIYADSFTADERDEFDWLCRNRPNISVIATVRPEMRVLPRKSDDKILAIGQKAAYFTGTEYFVNIVEGAGLYGFDGVRRLADMMCEAFLCRRNAADHIQQKGWGCSCCL